MNKSLVFSLALLLGWMGGEAHAAPWALSCPEKAKKLPRLLAEGETLEPSGVAWDPLARIAVGVSDESSPYSVFAFDPSAIETNKKGAFINTVPLLTPSLVKEYRPKDLEGITRLPNGEFMVTASLGLAKGNPRDTVLRFRLKGGGSTPWQADALKQTPTDGNGLRPWLIQAASPPWKGKINDKDGEEGINVEGLAASHEDGQVYFGFRGPTDDGKVFILAMGLDAKGNPSAAKWHKLKLGKGFDVGGILGREAVGIRDMTPLAGTTGNEFLLLLGASGSGSDVPFQIGWWRDDADKITLVGEIPKKFKAEGLTVTSSSGKDVHLLLVSDKQATVMECVASRKRDQ